jgi:glycosyltransferase involved in cell wall biosynthesis
MTSASAKASAFAKATADKPLRIGVDARELLGDATGVGRYLGELLKRWTVRQDAAARRFLLYAPEPLPLALPSGTTDLRTIGRGRGTWWEQTYLRSAIHGDRPDVFFAPAYTAPLGTDVPLAVTIHDISFVAHPEWFRAGEGARRRWLTRRAAHKANIVFTDSDFSRRELESYLRVEPSRIRVIPPGVTPRTTASAHGLRDPLVLFVGSIFNRRRIPDAIAAFAQATRDMPAARFAIVGDDRTWPRQDLSAVAHQYGVAGRTDFLRYVPDEVLSDLYRRARVFVFLSDYEGFGLTPLEALTAGVPIVVLDTPVAREVYDDAAVFVQRDDIPSAAQAIRRFLTEPASAEPLLARASGVLARYSWQRAADVTLAEIERIVRR